MYVLNLRSPGVTKDLREEIASSQGAVAFPVHGNAKQGAHLPSSDKPICSEASGKLGPAWAKCFNNGFTTTLR